MSGERNKHEAERWLNTAKEDIEAASILFNNERFSHACFLSQQAAEKAIKAVWFLADEEPWGHSILRLTEGLLNEEFKKQITGLGDSAAFLDKFYIPTRYPNGLPDLTPGKVYLESDASLCIEKAQYIIKEIEKILKNTNCVVPMPVIGNCAQKTKDKNMTEIYQIKVSLNNIIPSIWRQLLVKSDTKLFGLHKIIQTTMGWTNSHLHQFVCNNKFYCNPDYEDDWDDDRQIDYTKIKFSDLISKKNQSIIYEYDFGDGWEHTVKIEEILPLLKNKKYPVCIDGARRCPPEDCGGSHGYEDLLEIIKNPEHEEYDSMIEWLPDNYNPDEFDLNEINNLLKQKDYGCITLEE